jgi:hypothetical protein
MLILDDIRRTRMFLDYICLFLVQNLTQKFAVLTNDNTKIGTLSSFKQQTNVDGEGYQ